MKKFLTFLLTFAFSISGFAQTMKMVVNAQGKTVGKYVTTNDTTYTASLQDYFEVSKEGHKVVIFSPENGQGVVSPHPKNGTVNVRNSPSTQGAVIGKIIYEDGYIQDDYPCLGKVDGWYKIKYNNKIGYVRADLVVWDGLNYDDVDMEDVGWATDSPDSEITGTIGNEPFILTMRDDDSVVVDHDGFGYSGDLVFTGSWETYRLEGYYRSGSWFYDCIDSTGKTIGRLHLRIDYTGEYTNLINGKELEVKISTWDV